MEHQSETWWREERHDVNSHKPYITDRKSKYFGDGLSQSLRFRPQDRGNAGCGNENA